MIINGCTGAQAHHELTFHTFCFVAHGWLSGSSISASSTLWLALYAITRRHSVLRQIIRLTRVVANVDGHSSKSLPRGCLPLLAASCPGCRYSLI